VITYLEGEVLLEGAAAEIGAEVAAGAAIRTGGESYCEVVFNRRNIFRIEQNSLVVINIEQARGSIDLQQGSLAAVFQKLASLGRGAEAFAVRTPLAVAGIRGTVFYVRIEDPDRTYVCTCNGQIRLGDAEGGRALAVSSTNHKAYRFLRGTQAIEVRSAPLLYHDSSTMDGLAAKIRIFIPWGRGGYGESY
jgi:ferric-dicitrate binding protein FerR (iron transport regulator)